MRKTKLENSKYLYQVNDLRHPYVKVIAIKGEMVQHTHLGQTGNSEWGSANRAWFRPLTKKEELEMAVKYDY